MRWLACNSDFQADARGCGRKSIGVIVRHRVLLAFSILGFLCLGVLQATAQTPDSHGQAARAVKVQMRNVMYHFSDNVAVHIRSLRGELLPTKGDLPIFDDKESFTIRIASAKIAMTVDSLANVLNSYVFARRGAPLKDISIRVENERLKIKGKLHNKGDIPFETEGRLSSTEDGKIRFHAEKVKALHLPVKGLMELVGIQIADLIRTGKLPGVNTEKDDLILDPATLLPPPHINGQVTDVRLENTNVVQTFGHASDAAMMRVDAANYMAYRGNQLRFGKLTMSDTDMVLIDMDAKDPFDFYLDHYKEQLVAGYTKETLSFGLRVFMRDYDKLVKNRPATNSKSKTTR
jgi:hypothetical protein